MSDNTTNTQPKGMVGIRHVALFIQDLDKAVDFYTHVMGMQIEWQPDVDNVYLTNQGDVFALHRVDYEATPLQRLDHIGFVLDSMQAVDEWFAYFVAQGVRITEEPKTHRDGSRGFYCLDPVGNLLELIYHPPIIRLMTGQV